jgi:hypothetical protein
VTALPVQRLASLTAYARVTLIGSVSHLVEVEPRIE